MLSTLRKRLCQSMLLLATVVPTFGAGFSILEQSTAGLGRALGGMTADANEPGSIYFNPATAGLAEQDRLTIGSHFLDTQCHFNDRGSVNVTGGNGDNMGGWAAIPNFYWVHPINDKLSMGLGMSATSGTAISYASTWKGRYSSQDTEIAVLDLSATLAYKIRDDLSIGAGLITEHADVCLSQMIPYSFMSGGYLQDSQLKLQGDGVAFGFTAGILYRPMTGTSIGLGYRSRINHDLDLEARVRKSPFTGKKVRDDADAKLHLPSMVNFGVIQDVTTQWRVMGDISWTEWSVMDELSVSFDRRVAEALGGTRSQSSKMNWKDCWRYALGTEYDVNAKWTLRTGVAFDETPVRNARNRNTHLPDENRFWLCFGASYHWTENLRLDLAYTHIFFDSKNMHEPMLDGNAQLNGKVTASADLYSMSLTYSF